MRTKGEIVTQINTELWEGTVCTIKSQNLLPYPSRVTADSTYTREDVISVLAEADPPVPPGFAVRIQDSTGNDSSDNADHLGTARFAHEALGRVPIRYAQYRGYFVDGAPTTCYSASTISSMPRSRRTGPRMSSSTAPPPRATPPGGTTSPGCGNSTRSREPRPPRERARPELRRLARRRLMA